MPVVTTLSGGLIAVDLETRDFEGFRSDVLDSGGLADLYTPDWSDRSELDLGVALTEALCFLADNLSYHQDRCANEALFPSAVQRRSVIEHCKLLGYELAPATSAWVALTIVTSGAVTIPAGTSVSVDTSDGSDPATFELAAEFDVAIAGTTTGITAYEGVSVTDEEVGTGTGAADQSYELGSAGLTMNPDGTSSMVVTVTTVGPVETQWTEVDNFLASTPTDNHYRLEIDEYDAVTVIFGDGVNGAIVSSGGAITVTYRLGGGHLGNQVAIGKLTKLSGGYSPVTSVTNPAAPTGGIDRETIARAKIMAPLSLKANDRAVTHEDYKVSALKVSGVLHAHAYRGAGAYEERVVIAGGGTNPVPRGTWDPFTEVATDLIGAVGTALEAKKTTPVILYIDPVRVIEVVLVMSVYLYSNTRRKDALRLVEDAVVTAFDPINQTLGQQMPLSRVNQVVELVSGVDYVDIVQMQRIPNPKKSLGGSTTDMTFDDWIVNSKTVDDTYLLKMLTTTTFEVIGQASGHQGYGTVGTQFTSTSDTFSVTLNAGAIPASNTDKWTIKTGRYIGNVDPEFDEMASLRQGSFQLTVNGGIV